MVDYFAEVDDRVDEWALTLRIFAQIPGSVFGIAFDVEVAQVLAVAASAAFDGGVAVEFSETGTRVATFHVHTIGVLADEILQVACLMQFEDRHMSESRDGLFAGHVEIRFAGVSLLPLRDFLLPGARTGAEDGVAAASEIRNSCGRAQSRYATTATSNVYLQ